MPVLLRWLLCWCWRVPIYCSIPSCRRSHRILLFWACGLDAEIVSSSFASFTFSAALMYFPPGPLIVCFFVDTSFFGDFWNLSGVDISFCYKSLMSVVQTACSVPSMAIFCCFLYFHSNDFSLFIFSKNVYGYWKLPLTGFIGFLLGNLWDEQHRIFPFLASMMCSVTYLFSFRDTYVGICFGGTETFIVFQSDR